MAARNNRVTFSATGTLVESLRVIHEWKIGGAIVSATRSTLSNLKLVIHLAGLVISSVTSIIGGLTVSAALRLLADFWQVTQGWTLSGVIQSSTVLAGSLGGTAAHLLNGVIACSTAVINTGLAIRKLLGGIIICGTGGLYYIIAWLIGGAVQCSTVVTGGLSGIGTRLLNGAVLCSTALVGGLSTIGSRLLSGIVLCSTSVVGGGLRLYLLLSGLVISTGTVVAGGITTTASRLIGGIVLCSTVVTGALSGFFARFIGGVVICSTSVYSMISVIVLLGGAVVAATVISLGRFLGMSVLTLSGIVICGPSPYFNPGYFEQGYFPEPGWMLGAIKMGRPFQGAVACATNLANTGLKLGLFLVGAIANSTVVAAAVRLYMSLSGVIVSATVVLGNLFGLATWFFGGVVLCATPIVGALKMGRLLSGVVACVTVVSMGSLQLVKFLMGIITSVTSIFGAPGGGVSYWGITGVTEPQHLWPFSITGDFSDQGSTGGLTLLAGGVGAPPSWDGSGYLILGENSYLYCANDADLGSLGSTFSIIWEWVGINDYHGLISCAEGAGAGDGWFTWPYQANSRVSTYNPHDNRNDNFASDNSLSTTGGINQAVWVQDGGNAILYVNGEIAKTSTALATPTNNTTNNFVVNGVGGTWGSRTVHWLRVGILKGTAWSADDVAAIYAGPVGEPIGVNITIRVLLSSIIACATSMVGALKLGRLLNGAIQCATSVLGNLSGFAQWLLNGAIICATSVSGALKLGRLLDGVITCATSVSGALKLGRLLNGVIVCATSVLGALKLGRLLNGVIVCATSVSGALKLGFLLNGAIACGTTILGNVFGAGRWLLNGVVTCATSVSGALKLGFLLNGVIVCATSVLGAVSTITTLITQYVSGVIVSATSLLANVQRFATQVLGGIVLCVTAVTGSLLLQKMLSGVVVCGTTILGGLRRLLNLAGSIVSATSILGGLRNLPPVLLGGIITCGTYVLGAFYLVGTRLLGGIIVCGTYVYLGFLGPVVGGFGLGRHFLGGLHKWYIKAKERLKIDW